MNYEWPAASGACGCGVSVSSTSPQHIYIDGFGHPTGEVVNCAFGNDSQPVHHEMSCGCPTPADPDNTGQNYVCCGNDGCACETQTGGDTIPLEMTLTYPGCACVYTASVFVWDCENDGPDIGTTTGCCYGAGSAITIIITE
jgi:hypothetical protein